MQLAEDLQGPADLSGAGEDLGLRIALVRRRDDGQGADLAMLGVEDDALAAGAAPPVPATVSESLLEQAAPSATASAAGKICLETFMPVTCLAWRRAR